MAEPLDLSGLIPRKPGKRDIQRDLTLFALLLLLFVIVYALIVIFAPPDPPASIREVTPAEAQKISYLSERYGVNPYWWRIDRESGEVRYYSEGQWRTVGK